MQKFDAVIVGAGFSGMYMLHRLRQAGLSARVYEAGENVGGVWFWNRYPGAKCDVESIYYNYSFSEELAREWTWTERYPDQPSILRYLNHVADRFALRSDIQFNTRVSAAHYDEKSARWLVSLESGEAVSARYFISGVGALSSSNTPNFKGLENFQGEAYHTGNWPHQPVSFEGKRVGVIGTGSSGIQAIPVIAQSARQLYVFQRTPQYTTPAENRPYTPEEIRQARENLDGIRQIKCSTWAGTPVSTLGDSALAVSADELKRTYEKRWRDGGWMSGLYRDLVVNTEANATVGEFIRGKICEIVRDPAVAEKLLPTYQYATKRPVLDSQYYETFNRDNVTLVDIKRAPLEEITANGLRTSAGEYELDALVFATGYDAITGSLFRLNVHGKGGVKLQEKWQNGGQIRTYLGLATAGFPNFFMITGPESPSVLTNMVMSIEQHVEWIGDCIEHLQANGLDSIEATAESEEQWSRHCSEVADTTLFPQGESWYTGANIQGKTMSFPIYLAGADVYRGICNRVAANGYEGFALSAADTTLVLEA